MAIERRCEIYPAEQSRIFEACPLVKNTLLLLRELNNDDLNWFAKHGHLRELANGDTLIFEGEPIGALYFILSGTLSVHLASMDNRELARVSSGEIVGEISFVDNQMPLATVTAIANAVVLAIPRFHIAQKLERDASFASRFYRGLSVCLADRMRGTVGRLGYGVEVILGDRDSAIPSREIELIRTKFRWLVQQSGALERGLLSGYL